MNDRPVTEQESVEMLLVAIIEQAALDYEKAICNGDAKECEKIERLARDGSLDFTKIRLRSILKKIREKRNEFDRRARRHLGEIAEDSERCLRLPRDKWVDSKYEDAKFRCPMCGGGMYIIKQTWGRRVQCTGCNLFTWVERRVDGKMVNQL